MLILREELSGSSKRKVYKFRGWIVLDISENREETSVSAVEVNARGLQVEVQLGSKLKTK